VSVLRKIEWNASSRRCLLAFFVVLFWVVLVVHYVLNLPRAKQRQDVIDKELRIIPDPKASSTINFGSGFKTGNGYVNRLVLTELEPDQVEGYYRKKLEEQGWYFMRKEVRLSRIRVIFCGNDENAVLDLPESVAQKSYQFSLTISWGINYGCK